jgi:hypothetical protein
VPCFEHAAIINLIEVCRILDIPGASTSSFSVFEKEFIENDRKFKT